MKLISVIIPAYNAEDTIEQTVYSVLDQTHQAIEVIIINDGSTDNTLGIIENISDKRIQIFSYKNLGPSIARNTGIQKANGSFISFIDADDLWSKDKLEKQLIAIEKSSDYGVAYSWTYLMHGSQDKLEMASKTFFEGDVYDELLVRNFLNNGSNALIRKEAIDSVEHFNPHLKVAEEWDLFLRLAKRWKFAAVPAYQIYYRKSLSSLSSDTSQLEVNMLHAIDLIFSQVPAIFQHRKKDSLANLYFYLAEKETYSVSSFLQIRNSVTYVSQALSIKPSYVFSEQTINQFKKTLKRLVFLLFHDSMAFYQNR